MAPVSRQWDIKIAWFKTRSKGPSSALLSQAQEGRFPPDTRLFCRVRQMCRTEAGVSASYNIVCETKTFVCDTTVVYIDRRKGRTIQSWSSDIDMPGRNAKAYRGSGLLLFELLT